MFEIIPAFMGPLYFRYISKNWIFLELVGVLLSAVSAITIWFLPESPIYLHSKKRYDEARDVFKYISKVNTGKQLTFKFEEELEEEYGQNLSSRLH